MEKMPSKEELEESEKLLRKIMRPRQKAEIDSFHNTAYCMTRGCPHCDYFDCHSKESSGTLRTKEGLAQFQKCHTIPRAAQLSVIATDHKAIWIPMRPAETLSKKPFFSIESIKNILTFKGFCNSCDSKLFKLIDKPLSTLDIESAFLVAYRAFCYSAWRKEVDANAEELHLEKLLNSGVKDLKVNRENVKADIIKARKKRIEQKAINVQIANLFQVGIKNNFFGRLKTHVFTLNSELPFRHSGVTPMTRNILWQLQPMNWADCILTPIAFLSFLKIGGKDSLVVSWFDYVPEKFSNEYLDVMRDVSDNGDLSDVLVQFAAINNYGFAANPVWVTSWNSEMRIQISISIRQYAYLNEEVAELQVGKKWLEPCKIVSEEQIVEENIHFENLANSSLETAMLNSEVEFTSTKKEIESLNILGHKLMTKYYSVEGDDDVIKKLKISTEFLRIATRLGADSILLINAWNVFGRTIFQVGYPAIASMAFEFFLDKYSIAEVDESTANFLVGYHNCLMALKNIPKAIDIGKKAIIMYEELINNQDMRVLTPSLLHLLFMQMSAFLWDRKPERMLVTGFKGLKLIKENELEVSVASAGIYNNFTVGYIFIGDLNSAFDTAKLALIHYEELAQVNANFMPEYLSLKELSTTFDSLSESVTETSNFKRILNNLEIN